MRIQLSDHFTYKRLIRFVLPSIFMIICISVYGIIDGYFVSNFVGKNPFAAVNLIMPLLMGMGTIGFMVGTGGSAIVSDCQRFWCRGRTLEKLCLICPYFVMFHAGIYLTVV